MTPEEQLKIIAIKVSQLEARKVKFLTPFQHQRVLADLAKLEAERQKLLEENPDLYDTAALLNEEESNQEITWVCFKSPK